MDNNKIKFSVLMSVYKNDKLEFVKQSIDSILNQTLKPDEIVIVQDGPIPQEVESLILEYKNKYELFESVVLEENRGLGNALNIGLQYCSYDIVARMDADDICKNDRFEKQIKEFENDNSLSVVGGFINEFIDDVNKSEGIRVVPITHEEIVVQMKSRNPFNHMTVMFKKADVINSGNYQEFHFCEDYYLWIRMFLNGMRFKNIGEILANARVGNDMYKRRGGWKYYKSCVKLQKFLLTNKVISFPRFIKNVLTRFVIQILMPNSFRAFFYKKFARK